MKLLWTRIVFIAGAVACLSSHGATVFTQLGTGGAGLYQSSWWTPNGSDYDQYTWDNFTVSSNVPVTEVKWRGGFIYGGSGGPVLSFTITFYSSLAGGSQPDITGYYTPNPLATYTVSGNAGQTLAGTFGGTVMYDYDFVLPTPFQATAGAVYWIQIQATQAGIPDWGLSGGAGDGKCFRRFAYIGDIHFSMAAGDTAFSLLSPDTAIYTVSATASPSGGGSVSGTGLFPTGMTASLAANPATNSAFVNWTDNGTVVSTSPNYSFTVTADRALTANFAAGSTITTISSPTSGGNTTGGGNYTNGASITVTATSNANYMFVSWTENGVVASASSSYTFTVTTNRALVANFASAVANLAVFYSQLPAGSGSIPSSFLSPNGMDGDGYCFDSFVLGSTQDITDIRWYGIYRYGYSAVDPVVDFTISIYSSIVGGSQPDIGSYYTANPLKTYIVGGNAFETATSGMFAYRFTLPTSFHAVAGTKYWVQIEASQTGYPNDWGMAVGSGGDGSHFQQTTAGPSYISTGDAAFTLLGAAGTNSFTVATTAHPAGGGVTSGDGTFASGFTNTVSATPNAGFIFSSWSENGVAVSTNASYQFAVTNNRVLAANFDPAFSVSLAAAPTNGGSVSGAGTFVARANVTVAARPNAGYSFVNWTSGGAPVCDTTNYAFTLNAAQSLTANFALTPLALNQTNAPGRVGLNWNPAVAGWVLQESSDLTSGTWTNSTLSVVTNSSQRSVTISTGAGIKFFRLYHP